MGAGGARRASDRGPHHGQDQATGRVVDVPADRHAQNRGARAAGRPDCVPVHRVPPTRPPSRSRDQAADGRAGPGPAASRRADRRPRPGPVRDDHRGTGSRVARPDRRCRIRDAADGTVRRESRREPGPIPEAHPGRGRWRLRPVRPRHRRDPHLRRVAAAGRAAGAGRSRIGLGDHRAGRDRPSAWR
nr:hypothetical protein [Frankia sp. ArI3]